MSKLFYPPSIFSLVSFEHNLCMQNRSQVHNTDLHRKLARAHNSAGTSECECESAIGSLSRKGNQFLSPRPLDSSSSFSRDENHYTPVSAEFSAVELRSVRAEKSCDNSISVPLITSLRPLYRYL